MPPNFYYDQEDLLAGLQRGAGWHWTIFRPTTVYGFSLASPMNLTMVIAIYATIARELGLPMRFPGTAPAYHVIRQGVDAGLLADAILWAGDSPGARNQTFNITNGDVYRWSGMWPHLASRLGMAIDEPQRIPLSDFMGDKETLWSRIVARHGLRDLPYRDLVSWPFGTANFDREYDHILDSTKLRAAGFTGFRDSYAMFAQQISWLREQRIIPG
jgi:nucleoside-diphosphate-sugar epimerase